MVLAPMSSNVIICRRVALALAALLPATSLAATPPNHRASTNHAVPDLVPRSDNFPPLHYLGVHARDQNKSPNAGGTGFAMEGGGTRSLYIGLAVERGQRLLAFAERHGLDPKSHDFPQRLEEVVERETVGAGAGVDGSFLDDEAVGDKFGTSARVADMVSGCSGGTWGVNAVVYSPDVMRRLGR